VPKLVVTNDDLKKVVDTNHEWISTRTGISERRIATTESAEDLAFKAAKDALDASSLSPSDIDLIVVGTVTPDMAFPSTACLVQTRLGVPSGVPAFDVSAACSGFLYALDIADKYIKSGSVKHALVIGVDLFSRLLDWSDRSTCVLFGDGAGAVVLSSSKGSSGLLSSYIHSDGRHWEMLYAPMGEAGKVPFVKEAHKHRAHPKHCVKMNGNEVFKLAVRTMGKAIQEALDGAGLKPEDVSLLIPHQANIRIISAMQDRLKLPDEKVFSNIDKYGNTSAGSIPLALAEAVTSGRVKKGDIVLFVAFGGGLTWASAAVRW